MMLSIVIPVYNEEDRILQGLKALEAFLSASDLPAEILFVDDGSTDRTVEILEASRRSVPFEIVSYRPNRGKGFALKQGILKASGDYILFVDVDMSTPLEEAAKFREPMERGVPVIIGSRKREPSLVIKKQSALRRRLGEGFSLLSRWLLVPGISDFTCGFKMFRRDTARRLFEAQRIRRWGFDTEILFLARRYGYAIEEIPVSWINDERTKVRLGKDIVRSLFDLLRIRTNSFFGRY